MAKVFAPKEEGIESQATVFKKRFLERHTSTSCFYCQDSKLQPRRFTMPNGGSYLYAFACSCSVLENKKLTSINDLKEKLWCTLGGTHGMHCPLDNNAACRKHNCPKFESSYNAEADSTNSK
jgi:hypothetical protein